VALLEENRFRCFKLRCAYYLMTDVSTSHFTMTGAASYTLSRQIGVAAAPAAVSATTQGSAAGRRVSTSAKLTPTWMRPRFAYAS
jgi:hypothetical protein